MIPMPLAEMEDAAQIGISIAAGILKVRIVD